MKFSRELMVVTLLTSGCASIFGGTSQTISVTTNPPSSACTINQGIRPVASIGTTPGGAVVKKKRDDLEVICKKDGYQDSKTFIKSDLDPWVFGNIVLGGLIGLAVDWGTGGWNRYEEVVNMNLPPVEKPNQLAGNQPTQVAATK
jgi:hypothetical protein